MIRLCTGYPLHNNQTSALRKPFCTTTLEKLNHQVNKNSQGTWIWLNQYQKSSDPALLKLDYRSIVSTETLNPRCKIFVVSTDVINIISLPCSKLSTKIRLALKTFGCLGRFPGALSYLALTLLVCATEHDN